MKMKSTAADYVDVETEIWQPMHRELVNQGKPISWALYKVQYGERSKCDYYTVTTYAGDQQLNADAAYDEAFKTVHPDNDMEIAIARTLASRERVSTELWVRVDSTEIKEHRFAVVNMMHASDPDVYEQMESDIFKPGHQAMVDSGHLRTKCSTVDFTDSLGPAPMAESMMSAHPDRDLEDMHEMLEFRENVSSETWARVAATE